jgi:hypothetical protein
MQVSEQERLPLISQIEARAWLLVWPAVAALIALPALYYPSGAYEQFLALGSMLAVGIIGALAAFNHPMLGLGVLLLACLVSPVDVGPAPAAALIVAGLTLVFALKTILSQQKLEISRPMLPLVAFVLVASLSFVSGQFPWFPTAPAPLRAQVGGLGIFWLSALTFFLVALQVRDPLSLRRYTWVFLGVGGFLLAAYLIPGGRPVITLLGGSMGSLFWVWYIALAFGQAILNPFLQLWARCLLIMIASFALGFRIFVATDSASGWVPCLVAVMVLLMIGAPKLALALGLLAAVAVIPFLETIVTKVWEAEQYSLITRWEALKTLWQVIKSNPILGLGPSNYYFYTELFPLMGWYVKFNSHNNYLDLLAQTGIAGLLCFLWFISEVAMSGFRLLKRLKDGFERAFAFAAVAGIAGTLVAGALGDWFLPFVYNVGYSGLQVSLLGWFFMGGLVAIEQMRIAAQAQGAVTASNRATASLEFARGGFSAAR